MIGLDTNVLIRYFTQDDPIQSARATAWIEERLTPENPGFISVIARAETVWVLERTYHMTDQGIPSAVEKLLQANSLVVENEQQIFTAMIALRENQGSFADVLTGGLGVKAGCSGTIAFDRKALRLSGFSPAYRQSPASSLPLSSMILPVKHGTIGRATTCGVGNGAATQQTCGAPAAQRKQNPFLESSHSTTAASGRTWREACFVEGAPP